MEQYLPGSFFGAAVPAGALDAGALVAPPAGLALAGALAAGLAGPVFFGGIVEDNLQVGLGSLKSFHLCGNKVR